MKSKSSIFCAAIIAACFLSACPQAPAQDSGPLGLRTVVIDPGHGGKDPGAISKDKKTQERKLTLEISKLLKKKIEDLNPGVSVYMTREKDEVFVPLIDRARFATGKNADFFTSAANSLIPKSNPTAVDIHPRKYEVEWKRDVWSPYPLYLFGPCIDGIKKTMLPGLYVHKQIK